MARCADVCPTRKQHRSLAADTYRGPHILCFFQAASLEPQHDPDCQGPLCNKEQQAPSAYAQDCKHQLLVPWRPKALEAEDVSAVHDNRCWHVSCSTAALVLVHLGELLLAASCDCATAVGENKHPADLRGTKGLPASYPSAAARAVLCCAFGPVCLWPALCPFPCSTPKTALLSALICTSSSSCRTKAIARYDSAMRITLDT